MTTLVARRSHHDGGLPPEAWLVVGCVVTLLVAIALARTVRRVQVRRRARSWPAVDAVVSEVPARDGSPLLRYRGPDGALRSAPAVESGRRLDTRTPGDVVRVHVDPRDPQRVVPTAAAAAPDALEVVRPAVALAGLLALDGLVLAYLIRS